MTKKIDLGENKKIGKATMPLIVWVMLAIVALGGISWAIGWV